MSDSPFKPNPPRRPQPRMAGYKRQTESGSFNPYGDGRYWIIPRRGTPASTITSRDALSRLCYDSPLRLLTYLPDIHPTIGLALWNALRLTIAPGDIRIVAMTTDGGDEQVDPDGTAAINGLWESQPREIGGLPGLFKQLATQAFLTGLICLEAVPAGRGAGVARLWPVDSLSIGFKRDSQTSELIPMQRQMRPQGPTKLGYVELNSETFFWQAIDPMVDEPYGRAPYAPAIGEVLADIALLKDLLDSVHNGAWPRIGFGYNFTEAFKVAREVYGLDQEQSQQWVNDRFREIANQAMELKADDNVFYDSQGALEVIQGGTFSGLDKILAFLRQRLIQSVKSLPTLMGVNDGSTQTYTTVEWAIYASGLESIREDVLSILLSAANLHLRLLGMPLTAIAKVRPIRTTDRLVEANAKAVEIENSRKLVQMGFLDIEEASVELTGSGPVAPPMPGAFDPPHQDAPQGEADGEPANRSASEQDDDGDDDDTD